MSPYTRPGDPDIGPEGEIWQRSVCQDGIGLRVRLRRVLTPSPNKIVWLRTVRRGTTPNGLGLNVTLYQLLGPEEEPDWAEYGPGDDHVQELRVWLQQSTKKTKKRRKKRGSKSWYKPAPIT